MTAIPLQAMPLHSPPAVQLREERLSFLAKVVILYLMTYVFEGLFRFVLNKAHLGSLLYLRDLLPVAVTLGMLVAWITDRYRPTALLLVICIVGFHFFIGFFFVGRLFQQLFGLKVLLPMFLGLSLGSFGLMSAVQARKLATWALILSVAGILINYKVPYPWEGADFDTIFGANTQSRLWTSGGVRRLSGLARASYDAASVLLCAAVIVAATYRGVWWRGLLLALALLAIVLTTSKGAILAMVALSGLLILSQSGTRLGVMRTLVWICAVLLVTAPALAFILDVRMRDLHGGLAWSLSSYVERMQYTWPDAFKVLTDHGNLLIGRGIGGVGVAQGYGEARLYSPADNLFVYWTLACGMLGWVYGSAILLKLLRWEGVSATQRLAVFGFFIVILTYGVTANVMEQPTMSFGLGYAIAVIFSRRSQKKSAAEKE